MKTFKLKFGYKEMCEEDTIKSIVKHLPKELHQSAKWLIARTGLYTQMRFLEICVKEDDGFSFSDHIIHTVVETLPPTARDLAKALGMVFHGTWDEVPEPYSMVGDKWDGYCALVDAGILVLEDKDEYTMPEIWKNYLWLRGRFIWGEKPHDITKDYYVNCYIYKTELSYMKAKPPLWEECAS